MRNRTRRFIFVICVMLGMSLIAFGSLFLLKDEILFFFTPSEVLEQGKTLSKEKIRVGGLVQSGSLQYLSSGEITFTVTDMKTAIDVRFIGMPPNLFQENKGVVITGYFTDNIFIANELLAKHDENYRPPEIS